MGKRWKDKEEVALKELKSILKDELASRPQFPEVVGDRRLIRFLRGRSLKVNDTVKAIRQFFKWRDEHKVDDIRQDILYGGKDLPFKFPNGNQIIEIAPQIILSVNALDKKKRPLAMETFDFAPKEMFEIVSISDYIHFLIYTLEYRAIVLEQLSHERELAYVQAHPEPADREDGYGVTVMNYTIRDLRGVGMAHLGSKGRALVAAALEAALPNYPEFLERCVIINTPWIFTTFWYFVRGFLDEITMAKIDLCGTNFMPLLLEDMDLENIPKSLGGGFVQFNEYFAFDLSEGGALHYPGAPAAPNPHPPMTSRSNSGNNGDSNSGDLAAGGSALGAITATVTPETEIAVQRVSLTGSARPTAIRPSTVLEVRKAVRIERMMQQTYTHLINWAARSPCKLFGVFMIITVFVWARQKGWLEPWVFPSVIFVTLFNTNPLLRGLTSYFEF